MVSAFLSPVKINVTKLFSIATTLPTSSSLIQKLIIFNEIEHIIHTQSDLSHHSNLDLVLINWPFILPKAAIQKHYRILNVHNSLLPRYRGRHAFTWAMLHGEKQVGYTLHEVEEGIDSGAIFSQVSLPVLPADDINTLFQKGAQTLEDWLPQALKDVSTGAAKPKPQNEALSSYFPKRKPEDNLIDFQNSGQAINNFIRSVRPPYTPGAFFDVQKTRYFVDRCSPLEPSACLPENSHEESSSLGIYQLNVDQHYALATCQNGRLKLHLVCDSAVS